ncbi:hypothetical protein TeGR_g642, partial [Tetraparma gracilis]
GRSPTERAVFNTGFSYLFGTLGGSLYGLKSGLTSVPNSKLRVKVNSVLNHAGRYGSKAGNAMAAVCLLYSAYDGLIEYSPAAVIQDAEPAGPAAAAALAGLHYKSTTSPRVAALAGAIGAGGVLATYGAGRVGAGYQFGSKGFLWF